VAAFDILEAALMVLWRFCIFMFTLAGWYS